MSGSADNGDTMGFESHEFSICCDSVQLSCEYYVSGCYGVSVWDVRMHLLCVFSALRSLLSTVVAALRMTNHIYFASPN